MTSLCGRVAIVTGASRGIGEAISVELGRTGAAVVLAARSSRSDHAASDESTIEYVMQHIEDEGGRAIAVRTDLTNPRDVDALVARTHEVFGPIDILINNAAAFGMASALTMPVTRYRLCFEVNVFAPYRLMQLVLPDMVEKQGGHIVNISSDASRRPPPGPYRDGQLAAGGAAYGASKLALEHLTRSIAAEFSSRGVAVNAVMPSLPIATQSVLEAVPDTTEFGSLSDFVKAVMILVNADPSELNGGVWYSEDLRHPDRAPRGWLGSL